MTPFSIAGVQMKISATAHNLPAMAAKLDKVMALYPWVEMVVFSELAIWGPVHAKAQHIPGPAEQAFRKMAAKHGVWLIPGSMYEREGKRIYNTTLVIDPKGEVVGRYRKMFPFLPYERGVSAGDSFLVFDVPGVGRFGTSICYDMWFPETSRTLAVMGAEVILHPSLTGTVDRDAELSIARATAVMNQCYVFDINGLGDGGIGKSIVCDPEGSILHQAGEHEEIIALEIDLDRVRRSRELGIQRLGQVLKSFRDRSVEFDIYKPGARHPYLDRLGPLVMPTRNRHPVGEAPGEAAGEAPGEAAGEAPGRRQESHGPKVDHHQTHQKHHEIKHE